MNYKKSNNQYIPWIDAIRTLAISLVILNHSIEEVYFQRIDLSVPSILSLNTTIFMYVIFTLGRLGVPLFLFLSGMLLLPKDYSNGEILNKFFKKNFVHLLVCLLIWIFLYNIFNIVFNHAPFSFQSIILQIFFLDSVKGMYHMWYMYVILGLYLAIPFISVCLKVFSKKIILSILTIVIFYVMIIPSMITIINILGINKNCKSILDLNFLGSYFGVYLISGYYLINGILKKIKTKALMLTFIISFVTIVSLQVWALYNKYQFTVWYDFIMLYICSISLIECLSRLKIENNIVILVIRNIAKISFGLYFIHMPMRFILNKYTSEYIKSDPLTLLLFYVLIYCLSILCVSIINKIPYIKKWIF